jgi:hypothetical protein
MSYHVTGFTPGKVEDLPRLKEVWIDFVAALDELAGEPFQGFIAGGDWVGNDHGQANAFRMSAEEAREGGPGRPHDRPEPPP